MSFCRWSSDDFRCDLYCYEDIAGGYTTHVAGRRYTGDIPAVDWSRDIAKVVADHKAQSDALARCKLVPIGLAYDGATFRDPTPTALLGTLMMLREAGYRFPDYVLDDVRAEIAGQ